MSGLAILVQPNSLAQARDSTFQSFLQLVAELKQLDLSGVQAVGGHCTAAKLDSPASLHEGITRDERTGAWLMATGTVIKTTGDSVGDPSLASLLRDYIENGMAALNQYDGHFALAIYDGREESLSIISDPMGLFSIFYGSQGNQTLISTSALAVAKQISSKPDTLTIECFLRTGRIHGTKTLWEDVRRVPPATVLKFTRDGVEECEYWAPKIDESVMSLSFDEALAQATDLLAHAFKCILQQEGRTWADLTGGFDTRLATMLLTKVGIPFTAYCVGATDHPDVQISSLISQRMGWEYRRMPLPDDWEHEQCAWFEAALGKGDAQLNVIQLAGVLWGHQERASTSKTHVVGGGGEHLRGPYWRGNPSSLGRSSRVNYDYLLDSKVFRFPIPRYVLSQDRTKQVRRELRRYLEELASDYAEFPNTVKLDIIFIRHRHPIHSGAYLSAAAGTMRSLVPFCFKEPTSFAISLNYMWKLPYHHRFARALLERGNPRLASFETTTGGPAIPIRITNLHRFWPLWKKLINQATGTLSRRLIRRSVTLWPTEPGDEQSPLIAWRRGWLSYAAAEGLLRPSTMHSGALYDAQALQTLVSQAGTEDFKHAEFLGRIITVEMAMRAVGVSVEQ